MISISEHFFFTALSIGLVQDTYTVAENEQQVQLCASIVSGQLERNVEVSVTFTPNTASIGEFSQVSQTLTFSGQNTLLCFNVEIVDDQFFEDDETFFANLETLESVEFVQFATSRAEVVITNDDGNYCNTGIEIYANQLNNSLMESCMVL